MRATEPAVIQRDFIACDSFDVRRRLREIAAPALIIAGESDRMTPLSLSEELAHGVPNAALEVIGGAGHMLLLEKPDATADAIQRWLNQDKG